MRRQHVDLGNALLVSPNFDFPPAIVQGGLLRLRGTFPLRPIPIGFDLMFQNVGGEWRVIGIAVAPLNGEQAQTRGTGR